MALGKANSSLVIGQLPHLINNEVCDRFAVRLADRDATPPLRRIICQGSIDRTRTMACGSTIELWILEMVRRRKRSRHTGHIDNVSLSAFLDNFSPNQILRKLVFLSRGQIEILMIFWLTSVPGISVRRRQKFVSIQNLLKYFYYQVFVNLQQIFLKEF